MIAVAAELGGVHARAERGSGAGEHHAADAVVLGELAERDGQLLAQLDRERVALLRSLEGDERDFPIPVDRELIRHAGDPKDRRASARHLVRGRGSGARGDLAGPGARARRARDPDLAGALGLAQGGLEEPRLVRANLIGQAIRAATLRAAEPGAWASRVDRSPTRHLASPRLEPPAGGKVLLWHPCLPDSRRERGLGPGAGPSGGRRHRPGRAGQDARRSDRGRIRAGPYAGQPQARGAARRGERATTRCWPGGIWPRSPRSGSVCQTTPGSTSRSSSTSRCG